jgi:septation ring formation regulator EzrA
MAEIIDLNINIGANTTDFESALQKAENLLKQFEGALKKATNVGEINYLNTQIKGLQGTISGIKTQMSSVAKPTADATNALSNLSRVAQDAPYGFIGIANNLNPLLESFQRLQKESVNSGGALKAMIS